MRTLLAVLLLIVASYGATISSCSAISSPGYYELTNNVAGSFFVPSLGQNVCLHINSGDVILDCKGFSVSANVPSSSVGYTAVAIEGPFSNVTVRNCSITNATYVVGVWAMSDVVLEDISGVNNMLGISLTASGSDNITLRRVNVKGDSKALEIAGVDNVWVEDSIFNKTVVNNTLPYTVTSFAFPDIPYNLTFRNVTIIGRSSFTGGLVNFLFDGGLSTGGFATSQIAKNGIVRNMLFPPGQPYYGLPISFYANVSNLTIFNNTFTKNTTPIYIASILPSQLSEYVDGVVIKDNKFYNKGGFGIVLQPMGSGSGIGNISNVLIANNDVKDIPSQFVRMAGTPSRNFIIKNFTLFNNTINNASYGIYAVWLARVDGVNISNNRFFNLTSPPAFLSPNATLSSSSFSNIFLTNNVVYNRTGNVFVLGLPSSASSFALSNILVSSNNFSKVLDGLALALWPTTNINSLSFDNIQAKNNSMYESFRLLEFDLWNTNLNSLSFTNIAFEDNLAVNSDDPLYWLAPLLPSGNFLARDISVRRNRIYGDRGSGFTSIYMEGPGTVSSTIGSNIVIADNYFENVSGSIIYRHFSAQGTLIENNIFNNSVYGGKWLYLDGKEDESVGQRVIIRNNLLIGAGVNDLSSSLGGKYADIYNNKVYGVSTRGAIFAGPGTLVHDNEIINVSQFYSSFLSSFMPGAGVVVFQYAFADPLFYPGANVYNTTGEVRIYNNRFENVQGSGVLVRDFEPTWVTSGPGVDYAKDPVYIYNNQFINVSSTGKDTNYAVPYVWSGVYWNWTLSPAVIAVLGDVKNVVAYGNSITGAVKNGIYVNITSYGTTAFYPKNLSISQSFFNVQNNTAYVWHADNVSLNLYSYGPRNGRVEVFNSTNLSFAITLDNPSGGFTNYTRFVLEDEALGEHYSVEWALQPGSSPPNLTSFNGKFLNITNLTPTTLDAFHFTWSDSELGNFVESKLKLYKWNGTNWTLVNGTPNTALNYLSLLSYNNFSIFGIFGETGVQGDGGGATPALSVALSSDCAGNSVTVSSDGSPVSGAQVVVKEGAQVIASGTTNSQGVFAFGGCSRTVFITASKPGYADGSASGSLVDCNACSPPPTGCSQDSDCLLDEQCVEGTCSPIPCDCGFIQDRQCVPYECCADSDCLSGFVCSNNICVPAQPQQPPQEEGCVSDADCAQGVCEGGACVVYGIECDPQVEVGNTINCRVYRDGFPCVDCSVNVLSPDGTRFTATTDEKGALKVPADAVGIYEFRIAGAFDDSEVYSLKEIQEEQPSPALIQCAAVIVALLLLLVLLWKRRKKRIKGVERF